MTWRKFSREFKVEAVRLVTDRGAAVVFLPCRIAGCSQGPACDPVSFKLDLREPLVQRFF